MKHAIIVTGGKQYRVAEGDVIFVEKLDAAAGSSVSVIARQISIIRILFMVPFLPSSFGFLIPGVP